jgi:hypothetical protein
MKQEIESIVSQIRGSAQVAFAQDALRGIVLLNGGAIIALLTFFGQAWSKNPEQANLVMQKLKTGLLLFVFGALSGIIAQGLAYLAQQYFVEERRKIAVNFRYSCILFSMLGVIFFAFGSINSISGFIVK